MENLEIEKKKSSKGKTVFIIILILVILGLGGYIYYSMTTNDKTIKNYKDDINNLKKENKDLKKESLTDVQTILTNFIEDNKVHAVWGIGEKTNYKVEFNKDMVSTGIDNIIFEQMSNNDVANKETVDNYLAKFNITGYEHKSTSDFKYDSSTQTYSVALATDRIGALNQPSYIKVLDIKNKNNKYILTTNNLVIDTASNEKGSTVYADYKTGEQLFEVSDDWYASNGNLNEQKVIDYFENNYETLKDKISTVKYTFEKKDGEYILEKFEIN